jgi:hypothetical protein
VVQLCDVEKCLVTVVVVVVMSFTILLRNRLSTMDGGGFVGTRGVAQPNTGSDDVVFFFIAIPTTIATSTTPPTAAIMMM